MATRGVVEGVWNFQPNLQNLHKQPPVKRAKIEVKKKKIETTKIETTANPVVFAAMARAREEGQARGIQNNSWQYGQCWMWCGVL